MKRENPASDTLPVAGTLALGLLLTALCGCMANKEPLATGSRLFAHDRPTLESVVSSTTRSRTEAAIELATQQRYQAALEILEPMRPSQAAAAPAPVAKTSAGVDQRHRHEAEVLFWIAYCYEKQRRTNEALPIYRRVRADYPDTDFAPAAQARVEILTQP